jgi:hypothetical protein
VPDSQVSSAKRLGENAGVGVVAEQQDLSVADPEDLGGGGGERGSCSVRPA